MGTITVLSTRYTPLRNKIKKIVDIIKFSVICNSSMCWVMKGAVRLLLYRFDKIPKYVCLSKAFHQTKSPYVSIGITIDLHFYKTIFEVWVPLQICWTFSCLCIKSNGFFACSFFYFKLTGQYSVKNHAQLLGSLLRRQTNTNKDWKQKIIFFPHFWRQFHIVIYLKGLESCYRFKYLSPY